MGTDGAEAEAERPAAGRVQGDWITAHIGGRTHYREAMKLAQLLPPFDRWRNWGTEQLRKLHSK